MCGGRILIFVLLGIVRYYGVSSGFIGYKGLVLCWSRLEVSFC